MIVATWEGGGKPRVGDAIKVLKSQGSCEAAGAAKIESNNDSDLLI